MQFCASAKAIISVSPGSALPLLSADSVPPRPIDAGTLYGRAFIRLAREMWAVLEEMRALFAYKLAARRPRFYRTLFTKILTLFVWPSMLTIFLACDVKAPNDASLALGAGRGKALYSPANLSHKLQHTKDSTNNSY